MDSLKIHDRFCCFRLETGLTIAAWMEAIGSVLFLVLTIALACDSQIKGIYAVVLIAFSVLDVIVVIGLIFGVAMRNRFFIVPWMTMSTIQLSLVGLVLLPLFIILAPIMFAAYRFVCTFELFKHLQNVDDRIQPNINTA